MGRKKKNKGEMRNEIADAAQKSILKMGLHNSSLKDIASEAGVTTGMLMYYFRDKESLIFYVKNRIFDQMWENAKKVAEDYEGIDKLVAMAMVEIAKTPDEVNRERLVYAFKAQALDSVDTRRKQVRRDEKGWQEFQSVIDELKKTGVVSKSINSEEAALSIIAFIEGINAHSIIAPKVLEKVSLQDMVRRHVYAMVGKAK